MFARLRFAVALGVAVVIPSFSLTEVRAQAGPPPGVPQVVPPGAGAPAERPEFPKFEEVMKDYAEVQTSEPPFFELYHNKKSDSLRAAIPSSLVGQKFLIATSMAGGPVATGFQLDHNLVYFDRMDKNLVLMQVDPRYVEGGNEPVADVIKRSYGGDEILKVVPIVTTKGADLIIDLDQLFKGDFAGISGWGGGMVNPALSKWAKFKAFPQNIELTADLAMMRGSSGRRVLFHYSISKIPESSASYKPRAADDRIGYFMTVRKDWAKPHNAPTLFNRYIERWNLEKRDPSAEVSAPKNPIIWHIEKTVPLKFRRWVKEGILEWNKAFARCGFLDAIEVKQQEDYDRETKDLDPEDVRYNFFRWIVTGRAFAMGPSRAHPLTGQIFDADIVFDDSMLRYYVADYERLTGGNNAGFGYNPAVEDFLKTHPQWDFRTSWQRLMPNIQLQRDPDDEFRRNLMKHMSQRGKPLCECAAGMADQMFFSGIALEAAGLGRDNDEFIGQVVKEVVMHEVGHCLGLRHNFKGSTWMPMDEIEKHQATGDPNIGSVMDYNPAIVSPRGTSQGSFTTRSIGPYDYWAIEYGYRNQGKPYNSEDEMLGKIASRVAEAGLDYATDEDTFGFISPDPLSNRFDCGRDVMAYARRQFTLTDSLLEDISKWSVKDGQSYTMLRRAFMRIMGERSRAANFVARFVGGQIINRDHKADPDGRTPIVIVDAKKQRDAMKFVCDNVFAEKAYDVSPDLLAHLAPGRNWHWGSDDFDFQVEFNIHDYVANSQYSCLMTFMNPFTVARVHDNQVKFPKGQEIFTLNEHLTSLTDAIWTELNDSDRTGTDAKPFINGYRRNLQRMHLEMLMNLVLTDPDGTVPADANAIARRNVERLSRKIGKVVERDGIDETTLAHLTDVKKRIDKALEANYTVNGFRGLSNLLMFFREASHDPDRSVPILPDR
ncbi:MAG: zinc-dependent metalloprotease [Planctomycetes bacterium]|nr:zinc-dependent metalloprotease [Planctomycetota bacterium]